MSDNIWSELKKTESKDGVCMILCFVSFFLRHYSYNTDFYFFLNLRFYYCKKGGDTTIMSSSTLHILVFLGMGSWLLKASLDLLL